MLADNQLGAAATNIHDQLLLLIAGYPLGDTEVDQAGFLATGNDVYRAFQGGFCCMQKCISVFQAPESLCTGCANVLCGDSPQALAKAGKTIEGALLDPGDEIAFFIQPTAQPDHLLDAVKDAQFTMFTPRNQHVKAVASQVYGSIGFQLGVRFHKFNYKAL